MKSRRDGVADNRYDRSMSADPYQAFIAVLSRCKRLLITTHVRPDGDALGSTAALVLGLRKAGIDSEVLLLSALPFKYAFIYVENSIVHHVAERDWPEPLATLDRFDGLVVADTGTWSQLPGLRDRFANWNVPKFVIDHHLTQEDWADEKLVVTKAAAAGEIVGELFQQWKIDFDAPMAQALYLALVADTGWFQFSNTRPFTLRLAASLMEAGANPDELYQRMYQSERAPRILLQANAVRSLELSANSRVASMQVSKDDFATFEAGVGATENLVNLPLQIGTVAVSLLFVDPPEGGAVRVSARSKGAVDVSKFAEQFGGGGHARAAGLKIDAPLADARRQVVEAMIRQVGNGDTTVH